MLKATVESLKEALDKYSQPVRGEKWERNQGLSGWAITEARTGRVIAVGLGTGASESVINAHNATLAPPDNPQDLEDAFFKWKCEHFNEGEDDNYNGIDPDIVRL